MSILFFEGFETCGTELGLANEAITRPNIDARWDVTSPGGAPTTDSFFLIQDEFTEGFAIHMGTNGVSSSGNSLTWNVPSTLQVPASADSPTFILGVRMHIPITARSFDFFEARGKYVPSQHDAQLTFSITDSTDISLSLGLGAAFHTTTDILVPGQWHYLEFRFKNANLAHDGVIQVWVDGVLKIDLDPVDANNGMNLVATSRLILGTTTGSPTAEDFVAYDDIYIIHEDVAPHQARLGRVRVRSIPPVSDRVSDWSNFTELTLATTLDGAAETQIDVGSGNIPAAQPASGNISVTLDTGQLFTIVYTSHDSDGLFTTAPTDWTNPADATAGVAVLLSGNTSWDKIDENGVDPTDYVSTDVQNTRDRYNLTDLIEDRGVWCMKVEAEAINETGGTPSLTIEIESGVTIDSTELTVDDTVDFELFDIYYELDPNTSSNWLKADIDALMAGFLFDNKVS